MKTLQIARGIAGVLSLVGVTGLVGCGAETGGPEAQIGSTSEALITNGQSLYFGGSLRLDSSILNSNGNADNLELWVGGMTSTGAVSTMVGYYDRQTDTFTALPKTGGGTVTLPTGLTEPEVALIPGTSGLAYLVVGGRESARDGVAIARSYVLKLTLDNNSKIASGLLTEVKTDAGTGATGTAISQARVLGYRNLKPCGTGSRMIAIGGITTKGFYDVANVTATPSIEVFTYNAGHNGGDSTWATLKDNATPTPNTVTLTTLRGYHEVLDKDNAHTTFYVAGGMNENLKALSSTEKIVVNNDCVATNADPDAHSFPEVGAMPGARARFASLAVATDSFGSPSRNYEFVAASGNDTTDVRPTAAFLFDVTSETWTSATGSLQEGKIFGRFLRTPGASSVKLVTGIKPDNTSSTTQASDPYYDTSLTVDTLADSAHAIAAGTSLGANQDRFGTAVDSLKNGAGAFADYVGFGAKHTNTTGATPNATSMPADFLTF